MPLGEQIIMWVTWLPKLLVTLLTWLPKFAPKMTGQKAVCLVPGTLENLSGVETGVGGKSKNCPGKHSKTRRTYPCSARLRGGSGAAGRRFVGGVGLGSLGLEQRISPPPPPPTGIKLR